MVLSFALLRLNVAEKKIFSLMNSNGYTKSQNKLGLDRLEKIANNEYLLVQVCKIAKC